MTEWQQELFEQALAGLHEIADRDGARAVIACTSYWYDEANAARETGGLSEDQYWAACDQLRAAVRALPGEHSTRTFEASASLEVPYTIESAPGADRSRGR